MVRKRALKEGGQRDVCSEVKIDYEMQPMVAEKGQAFRYAVGAGDTIWGKETHGRDP